jgi:hypothetical protein
MSIFLGSVCCSLNCNSQVCTAPSGGHFKLTPHHVLLECAAVESCRNRLGITVFAANFENKEDSYAAYVSGLSLDGKQVSVVEHLQRGRALKELQEVWLAVWGAE